MASAAVMQPQGLPDFKSVQVSVPASTSHPTYQPNPAPVYAPPAFDPDFHMCYTPPEHTTTLAELALSPPTATSPVAITSPFPLLTAAGVREVRADLFRRPIISKYGSMKFPGVYRVRGYGSDAPFVYDLWQSEAMRRACSAAAGVDLEIVFDYEIGHLNVQLAADVSRDADISDVLPPAEPPRLEEPFVEEKDEGDGMDGLVVSWHKDSYPWVCVCMLSDPTGMRGGETALRTGDGQIIKMKQPGKGYAVMMQGGSISHAGLRSLGDGERITMVTSFRPRNPMLRDTSTLRTVKVISNLDVLFKQWTTYRMEVMSKRATVLKMELETGGKDADVIKAIMAKWVEEQVAYLRNTVEEMG